MSRISSNLKIQYKILDSLINCSSNSDEASIGVTAFLKSYDEIMTEKKISSHDMGENCKTLNCQGLIKFDPEVDEILNEDQGLIVTDEGHSYFQQINLMKYNSRQQVIINIIISVLSVLLGVALGAIFT